MTCLRIHPFTGDLSVQGMDHERAYSCTYPSDKRSRDMGTKDSRLRVSSFSWTVYGPGFDHVHTGPGCEIHLSVARKCTSSR